jgi:hypothetical protein
VRFIKAGDQMAPTAALLERSGWNFYHRRKRSSSSGEQFSEIRTNGTTKKVVAQDRGALPQTKRMELISENYLFGN